MNSTENSKVILITGAGKGIGKALVEKIIARKTELGSPKLMLTSRTLSDLEALQTLAQKAGLTCDILPLDLASDPARAVVHTVQKFGRIDQLIHSAGVGRFGNFLKLTRDDLEFTMKTNVEGSFFLMQAAYAQMKNQKPSALGNKDDVVSPHRGDIVFITSVAAERPFEHSAIYCMSKYAQRGLIDVMRLHARKDGIRIIDVKPGAVLTPMWGEVTPDMIPKMMMPEDIAQLIVDALLIHPRSSVEEILVRPIGGDL
jgi:sepiapterin reductase